MLGHCKMIIQNDIPSEKVIELVNQLHDISKSNSIPIDQIPGYIKQKLEEKQKIGEEIKEADATPQSKNVNIEAVKEHIQLKEKTERL
jgi:uncharacterized protein (UPF0335 family)